MGNASGALGQMPAALAPLQQVPARREAGGKGMPEMSSADSSRRQRSSSGTRESRRAEAVRTGARPTENIPSDQASGANHAGDQDQGGGAPAAAAGVDAEAVQEAGHNGAQGSPTGGEPGTDVHGISDYESSISDIDLDSGSEVDDNFDMDVREHETEAERKARIAKHFKDRLQARAKKARRERRRTTAGREGVRRVPKIARVGYGLPLDSRGRPRSLASGQR